VNSFEMLCRFLKDTKNSKTTSNCPSKEDEYVTLTQKQRPI
jgi:hypothetical protein